MSIDSLQVLSSAVRYSLRHCYNSLSLSLFLVVGAYKLLSICVFSTSVFNNDSRIAPLSTQPPTPRSVLHINRIVRTPNTSVLLCSRRDVFDICVFDFVIGQASEGILSPFS